MTGNIWHDIPSGTPEQINVIIENPRGSKNKYELDKVTGLLKLDRVMHTAQDFPVEYGFVPQTLWDDGDALDVILLSTYPFVPGVLVEVRPVGGVKMIDGGENDYKVIGVPTGDPRFAHIKNISDINSHTLKEIEHFFLTYKNLQNKVVKIEGFGDYQDAKKAFVRSIKLYKNKYPK